MTREKASDLAKFTAEALGQSYAVCRSLVRPEEYQAFTTEAVAEFKGEWRFTDYEVLEIWTYDGRQIIARA